LRVRAETQVAPVTDFPVSTESSASTVRGRGPITRPGPRLLPRPSALDLSATVTERIVTNTANAVDRSLIEEGRFDTLGLRGSDAPVNREGFS
jgi:hypothetical protein